MRVNFRTVINDVTFEGIAEVTPGRPATSPNPDRPGDPPEEAEIEIKEMDITMMGATLKISNEAIRKLYMLSTIDLIQEAIMEEFYDQRKGPYPPPC